MNKDRPILFSGPMVRALLDGSKTQTRRAWRVQPPPSVRVGYVPGETKTPYGQPGDQLWVREAWRAVDLVDDCAPRELDAGCRVWYEADAPHQPGFGKLRPSIFMPRWASRITLEVTGVRVERLQAISEADAMAEGCKASPFPGPWWQGYREFDGDLMHQQAIGETPPDWMIDPKRMKDHKHLDRAALDAYRVLWESINGPGTWDANPYVWVIEFKRTI